MPNLRGKTWTTTTPANVEDAQYWEDHLISDTAALKAASSVQSVNSITPDAQGNVDVVALPAGGTAGQVLTKQSSTTGDADWEDPASSGHTIEDEDGNIMPYQETLQFENAEVTNDSVNNKTIVDCKGSKGDAATITVGTVTTLPAGSDATVTNSGTSSDAVFDFGIPKGADGTGAVDSVNGQTGVVVLDALDVGALPDSTTIPTKTSELDNDSGFVTSSAIPTSLSELSEDTTHRLVTDAEKTDWDAKVSETLLKDTVGWVGKNEFDKEHNYTLAYATLVQTKTGFEITGTVRGYTTILYKLTNLKKNTDYKFKCLASTENGSRHVRIRRQNGAVDLYDATDRDVFEATFNTGNYDYIQVNFYAGSDSTPSNSKVTYSDIMIWEASITDSTFEPFHKSVEQTLRDAEVIEGKNRLDNVAPTRTNKGVTFTVNADKSVTRSGTATGGVAFSVLTGKGAENNSLDADYTTPIFKAGERVVSLSFIQFKHTDGTYGSMNAGVVTTLSKDIGVFYTAVENGQSANDTIYPMVCTEEEWNKSHDFEPYYIPLKDSKFDRAEQRVLGAYNLCDYKKFTANGTTITFGDESIRVQLATSATWKGIGQTAIPCNTNTNYVVSLDSAITSGMTRIKVSGTPTSGGTYTEIRNSGDKTTSGHIEVSFNTGNNKYLWIEVFTTNNTITTCDVTLSNIMLSTKGGDFAPYAMTNRELTEELTVKQADVTSDYTLDATRKKVTKIGKLVSLDLVITGITCDAWGIVATIPDGYKPALPVAGRTASNSGFYIGTTGAIQVDAALTNQGFTLHAMWFTS